MQHRDRHVAAGLAADQADNLLQLHPGHIAVIDPDNRVRRLEPRALRRAARDDLVDHRCAVAGDQDRADPGEGGRGLLLRYELQLADGRNAGQQHEAAVANYANPDHPELEDYGHANLVANNGATNYFRVDWLTPTGLRTWGDARTVILGNEGYIEMRKYIDLAREGTGDHLFLANGHGEKEFSLRGKVGFPFFGQLILDCLNRTDNAMTQAHAFKAAELCLKAQLAAKRIA